MLRLGLSLLLAAGALAACGDDDVDDAAPAPTVASTSSSSTVGDTSTTDSSAPGGSAPPGTSPAGDPALPAVRDAPRPDGTNPRIRLGPVLAISRPSAVADPPGSGPVFVSTLDGQVHLVDLASGAAPVVLDLADRIATGGERGLLGIAVDPQGGRLYVDYTDTTGDTRVRSWALGADGRPEGGDGVEHLHLPDRYPNHNGGNLVFGPDGALWIGTGDGGSGGDPEDRAQDPGDLLGKMLRVVPDPAGGLRGPATNPSWGGPREIWGIGLRNPWRYSFDRATNRLWIADVGQGSVEEVSVIDPANPAPNFGWDDVEGDRPFEGSARAEFTMPVVTYTHADGCSVTGGYVYRGSAVPSLYGWYLFGDYCGGWVRAVPSSDPTRAPVELLADVGDVTSFGELEDGELLLLTSDGLRRIMAT
jgi:glucose/arabinose dehydrogenase